MLKANLFFTLLIICQVSQLDAATKVKFKLILNSIKKIETRVVENKNYTFYKLELLLSSNSDVKKEVVFCSERYNYNFTINSNFIVCPEAIRIRPQLIRFPISLKDKQKITIRIAIPVEPRYIKKKNVKINLTLMFPEDSSSVSTYFRKVDQKKISKSDQIKLHFLL